LFFPSLIFSAETLKKYVTSESQTSYHIILRLRSGNPLTQTSLDAFSIKYKLPIALKLIKPMAANFNLVEMDPIQLSTILLKTHQTKLDLFNNLLTALNSPNLKNIVLCAGNDGFQSYEKPTVSFRSLLNFLNYHSQQWDEFLPPGGVELESAPGLKDLAWQLTQGSPTVVVAVIDTGVSSNADLNNNLVQGWNFATPSQGNNVSDLTSGCINDGVCHGTHVAGTVAAIGNDGTNPLSPAGMGPQLKILPENVFPASGLASDSDIINAMYWAIGRNTPGVIPAVNPNVASVLNLSLGSSTPATCDSPMQVAMSEIKNSALIVVAAGNSNAPASEYTLTNCGNVFSVAATDFDGLRATYSNYGSAVNIAAPGGQDNYSPNGILSTTANNAYLYISGTSMAAPHVAGIAGLIYSYASNLQISLTPDQVKELLITTINPFGISSNPDINCNPTGIKSCGVGIVNAFASLKALSSSTGTIFIPPANTNLNLQNHAGAVICKNNFVIPALKTGTKIPVQSNNYTAYWQIQSADCEDSSVFTNPVIIAGTPIKMKYGNNNIFDFIPPAGLMCQVILNTSVVCH